MYQKVWAILGILDHQSIVWVNPTPVFGRVFWHFRHELCMMGWVQGNEPKRPTIAILAYGSGLMNVPSWSSVAVDLEGLDASGQIALLADHDARVSGVVGHGCAEVRDGRLFVNGVMSGAGEAANRWKWSRVSTTA